MRAIAPWLAMLAALAMPIAPAAQARPLVADAALEQRLEDLYQLAARIYAYDRAAWVATDALFAKVGRGAELSGVRGWVVTPDGADLIVTFFQGEGAQRTSFFVARTREGRVVEAERSQEATALTPTQQRLIGARDAAADEARRQGYTPCTQAPFNPVVLPDGGDDAPIRVYLLSAQTQNGSWPLGGHYLVRINVDGTVRDHRRYAKGCMDMQRPEGAKPAAIVVTHLLDPQPTEIHVFSAMTSRLPIFVATTDRKLWRVDSTGIAPIGD
ncbi:hypothetical protein [Sphingomonas sp.]|uniref:hypothetical protein n=1 Tax=Sphingomonas sp. TaxID=28214 RepID=UPI001EB17928|nr:hypothetical protein [Sphingomonas sp.]MBX3595089.1 hypothetical protein [Sphingomonas sp.]